MTNKKITHSQYFISKAIKKNNKMIIILRTKLYSRNLIKGINTWVVHLFRFSGPFIKRTREEPQQMDQRIGKLMMMHKGLRR